MKNDPVWRNLACIVPSLTIDILLGTEPIVRRFEFMECFDFYACSMKRGDFRVGWMVCWVTQKKMGYSCAA